MNSEYQTPPHHPDPHLGQIKNKCVSCNESEFFRVGTYVPRCEKPVVRVSVKASFKLVSSATETSWKIEILPVARLKYGTFRNVNDKGADQTARMRRLVCACVVCKHPKRGFLALRPIYFFRFSFSGKIVKGDSNPDVYFVLYKRY